MQDVINNAVSTLLENIQERIVDGVNEAVKNMYEKFCNMFQRKNAHIITESVETLNKEKLIDISTKYIVEGSTEVAAYKVDTEEDYIIYLAYTNNRELLDEAVNNYVIIKAQALARDVEKLFDNHELILLK